MSGRKGSGKPDIVSRREGVEKLRRSGSCREVAEKLGSTCSNTKSRVPKARSRPSSSENNLEELEPELIMIASSEKNREGQESDGRVDNSQCPVQKARNPLASLEKNPKEQEESELVTIGPHGEVFQDWMTARQYRLLWESQWFSRFSSFEDTTTTPAVRFTEKPPTLCAFPMSTLQIFSVKLCEPRRNLKFPVDVFGMVAVRDAIDHNRNIIFHRKREDCQTLTQKNPYLVLTGPSRAVVLTVSDPVMIEVELWKKGMTMSEDKYFSFLVAPLSSRDKMRSCLLTNCYTSKLSTLEFKLGHIVCSVEAMISVHLTDGSWPSSYRGVFTASAQGCSPLFVNNVDAERIVLLDSGDEKVPVTSDGAVKLSRRVISVEIGGKVKVYVKVLANGQMSEQMTEFKSSENGKSYGPLNMDFCKMQVNVSWLLISLCRPRGDSSTQEKQKVGM